MNNSQISASIKKIFDSIASKYDIMNTIMTLGLDRRWRRFAVRRSGISRGGTALDVCCGSGKLAVELTGAVSEKGMVIGIDFSENMLTAAKKNIGYENIKNIYLINGDALSLPFPDNTFDCVTTGWGLRNIPDIRTAISEMTRVVKPEGKIVSIDMGQPELPVFRQMSWLLFKNIIPLLGLMFAKNRGAYKYLYNSARAFSGQRELTEMFKEAGLSETRYHNFIGGVVALVEGRKL